MVCAYTMCATHIRLASAMFMAQPMAHAMAREQQTRIVFADGRALIEGTEDTLRARAVYDRYVGS